MKKGQLYSKRIKWNDVIKIMNNYYNFNIEINNNIK